jgi:PIN domain nuclease of toxin-antitoxin system
LLALLEVQGGGLAGLDGETCATAGIMPWIHPDPFDRLLAATARRRSLPIVSADTVFDGVVTRVWKSTEGRTRPNPLRLAYSENL